MSASRGPIPKRSEVRIRKSRAADGMQITTAPGAGDVVMPEPEKSWDDVVYEWYCALAESGQARYYEPSDWMAAYIAADWLNSLRKARYVGMQTVGPGTRQEPHYEVVPMNAGEMSAFLKVCAALGVTEGDRRRMRIELTRGDEGEQETAGSAAVEHAKLVLMQGGAAG